MKKLLYLALVLALVFVLAACGEKAPSEGLEFTLNLDEKSYSVSGIGTCTDTDVFIPSTYDGLPVTDIASNAFEDCTNLTRIEIPDSVTSIGNYAFWACSNLTSIEIPDKPLLMGSEAFRGTAYYDDAANWTDGILYIANHLILAKADISGAHTVKEGTKYISGYAFFGCDKLTSIEIPDSVTNIGGWTFNGCRSLNDVRISDLAAWCNINFDGYDSNPLSYAKNLYINGELVTDIVIPDSVTSIGNWAFRGYSSLTGVEIPESVTSIGDWAFGGCSGLTSIEISDSVTHIGDFAFSWCSGLTRITVADGNPVYHSTDNCLIETASKTLIAGCSTSVIPADGSVTNIGGRAFGGCSGLTNLEIPDCVTSIGDYAFSECSNLTSIEIPVGVTSIGDSVFLDCSGLTSIVIPNGVTSIGEYAFCLCSSITRIDIPDSVTSIDSLAFSNCSNLTNITFGGTKAQWDAIEKFDDWNYETGNYTIHCTDGDISK